MSMAAETSKGQGRAPSHATSVTSSKRDWRLHRLDTDFPLPSKLAVVNVEMEHSSNVYWLPILYIVVTEHCRVLQYILLLF